MKVRLCVFILLVHLLCIFAQTTKYLSNVVMIYDKATENVTSSGSLNQFITNVTYWVPSKALEPKFKNQKNYVNMHEYLTKAAVTMETSDVYFVGNSSLYPVFPNLYMEKTIEQYNTNSNPDTVKVSIWIYNNDPTNSAFSIRVNEDLTAGLLVDYGTVTLDQGSYTGSVFSVLTTNGRKKFTWNVGNLTAGQGYYMTYVAEPGGNVGRDLTLGSNLFTSSVYFSVDNSGDVYSDVGPVELTVCVNREDDVGESLVYKHGFTALAFFLALILGIVLVIGGVCLYRYFQKRKSRVMHDPERDVIMHEKGNRLVMDADKAMRGGGHTITTYSMDEEESIAITLAMKDRLGCNRQIDTLDIVSAIAVDQDIEKQRNDASEQVTNLFIQGLKHNRDINQVTEDQAVSKHKRRKGGLQKQLDDEYNNEKRKLLKKLSAKNKAKMSRIHQRQRKDKKRLVSENSDLGDPERKQVLQLMDEQHQTEQNEETYRLKLEQDEEMENLRKEFAARKRMGLKELQQDLLKDVQEQGQLTDEKAEWLIKEHQQAQKNLEHMYDDEISRQRMQLEEKLERRRALAKLTEQTEDDHSKVLNTLASHQLDFIDKAKKKGVLPNEEAQEMIAKATKDMIDIRTKMNADKERQEAELQKKLTERKKQRLAQLRRHQESELEDYERKNASMQTDGPVDPLDYVQGRVKIQAKHRQEIHKLNNDMDVEHAEELEKLREDIGVQTQQQLDTAESQITNQLKTKGISDATVNQLIQTHSIQMQRLKDEQERNLQQRQQQLQEKLQQHKEQWMMRKAAEKQEQQQLREHEENIVNKLITGQMVMSDEERDKILKEHEKQMVKLENNLTLNKLKQKRMLEEKLQQKREKQLHKLEQKHQQETQNQRRKQENNAEESDEESQKEKLGLLKVQFGQKMAIIQGQKLDLEDAMESVRVEMLKQRATALREQENKLGEMVAALKLSKEHEITRIKDQQQKINDLKANLMDDLNERGILDNHECQEIIERYKEEQDNLKQRLDANQKKREKDMTRILTNKESPHILIFKELKMRLKRMLEQRETSMAKAHEQELQLVINRAQNKTAAKLKKMLLIHNHLVQMEQMRNRLEREISQTLEDTRRQHELRRMEELQNAELNFIKKMVMFGGFKKEDLTDVLHLLFPGKTDAGISQLMERIFDPKDNQSRRMTKDSIEFDENSASKKSLVRRVQDSIKESKESPTHSYGEPPKPQKRKKSKPKAYEYAEYGNQGYNDTMDREPGYNTTMDRPEPIGENVDSYQMDGDYMQAKQLGKYGQLPPIDDADNTGGKKKRKKKKLFKSLAKQERVHYDDDDLL